VGSGRSCVTGNPDSEDGFVGRHGGWWKLQ